MQKNQDRVLILAIESSCDETSASIIEDGVILSNVIAGQLVHEKFGGVVPELASRAHQQNVVEVVSSAIEKANIKKEDLSAVAFTKGPGLLGSLLVGTSFAKAFALGLNIPLIDVNHMEAHILAHFIEDPKPNFPFLCLTVSGGHTQLVKVTSPYDFEIIGETKDDAVGEAFDKVSKMLGLGYPGGPLIDKYSKEGNPNFIEFPVSSMPNYDFSFSGIKTSVLYYLEKELKENPNFINENLSNICASFQNASIKMLLSKLRKASRDLNIKNIGIAGGVSANSELRNKINELGQKEKWEVFIPRFEYCTDNAAMIAMAAHFKYLNSDFVSQTVSPEPRLKIF